MITDEYEAELRKALAILVEEYRERAKPIVDRLMALESLKPPPPMIIDIGQLPPELLAKLQKLTKA